MKLGEDILKQAKDFSIVGCDMKFDKSSDVSISTDSDRKDYKKFTTYITIQADDPTFDGETSMISVTHTDTPTNFEVGKQIMHKSGYKSDKFSIKDIVMPGNSYNGNKKDIDFYYTGSMVEY